MYKMNIFTLFTAKSFPNEEIIEEYFELHYKTGFTFKIHMLVIEIDKNRTC